MKVSLMTSTVHVQETLHFETTWDHAELGLTFETIISQLKIYKEVFVFFFILFYYSQFTVLTGKSPGWSTCVFFLWCM